MRLWSLHLGYLDARGLVALWREALLAQVVLAGKTRRAVCEKMRASSGISVSREFHDAFRP